MKASENIIRAGIPVYVAGLLGLLMTGCATTTAEHASTPAAPTVAAKPAEVTARAVPADENVGMAEATHAQRPASIAEPTPAEIEAGLQVTRIASTAQGGMVDARFRILDPVKVAALLSNMASQPQLVADGKPPLIAPHSMMKGGRLSKDQIIAILYPNVRTAVKPGEPVVVALGAVRLGPVIAQ